MPKEVKYMEDEKMIPTLHQVKDSKMEKSIRRMLLMLNEPAVSEAGLKQRPQFYMGYITFAYEVLGEPIDTNKYFGIFDLAEPVKNEKQDSSRKGHRRVY